MKLITWNCNGALRNKFESLLHFQADILIIQECEDPHRTKHNAYKEWASNHLWIGKNKNKGIGIFANDSTKLTKLEWFSGQLELFLPCRINDKFNILGVWTRQANSPNFGYIGQFWKYLQINRAHFQDTGESIIIAGDFNSNTQWDQWDRWWNHSDVVRELKFYGLESVYHKRQAVNHGDEETPTFYHYRKLSKPYHIDYIWLPSENMSEIAEFEIGEQEKWLSLSDHMPLYLLVKNNWLTK